jgi:multidrug transporter EmrE-like cation transporter
VQDADKSASQQRMLSAEVHDAYGPSWGGLLAVAAAVVSSVRPARVLTQLAVSVALAVLSGIGHQLLGGCCGLRCAWRLTRMQQLSVGIGCAGPS